jgi:hypothetical protein
MVVLAREMSLAFVSDKGLLGLLERLSDPIWFYAFGCVLGFDWHSSGVTHHRVRSAERRAQGPAHRHRAHRGRGKGRASRPNPPGHRGRLRGYGDRRGAPGPDQPPVREGRLLRDGPALPLAHHDHVRLGPPRGDRGARAPRGAQPGGSRATRQSERLGGPGPGGPWPGHPGGRAHTDARHAPPVRHPPRGPASPNASTACSWRPTKPSRRTSPRSSPSPAWGRRASGPLPCRSAGPSTRRRSAGPRRSTRSAPGPAGGRVGAPSSPV